MINIPEQLKKDNIRFILVQPKDKRPFEVAWVLNDIEWTQQDNGSWKNNKTGEIYLLSKTSKPYTGKLHSYRYDDPELLMWLEKDGNYGCCGGNGLILIDFDDEQIEKLALLQLPDTFTVRTGSNRLHLYYFTNGEESFKGFSENLDTLFDAQCSGKMCIGANSQHPNLNYYKVEKDIPITFIDYAELKAKLMAFDRKPKNKLLNTLEVKYSEKKEYKKIAGNNIIDSICSQIKIPHVLSWIGTVDTNRNPTNCPLGHNSKGGSCFGYNNDVFHCFHCEAKGGIFGLVQQYKNCSFKEALDILAGLAGLKDELIDSKKKYVETMRRLEAEALVDKLAKEKERLVPNNKHKMNTPGNDRVWIAIDGSKKDPVEDMVRNRMKRLRVTRGTTLGKEDDSYKIKLSSEAYAAKEDDSYKIKIPVDGERPQPERGETK